MTVVAPTSHLLNLTSRSGMIELGGTIGDIESMPFIEALRQLKFNLPETPG